MNLEPMTSLERVQTAMNQHEPDRVPLSLSLSLQGVKELGLPLRQFFSSAGNIVQAQLRMADRYRGDSLSAFTYAAVEFEAFGGESLFSEDGPPNSGQPIIRRPEDILSLEVPDLRSAPGLQIVLEATRQLYAARGKQMPIIGSAISPFSLPVMQMGFEAYLNLLYDRPELFQRLMQINQQFCVEWSNAQLAAGATAIVYVDPLSSPTILTPELYRTTGKLVAAQTILRSKVRSASILPQAAACT
jgi:uroporphyrinogen decarboxylase